MSWGIRRMVNGCAGQRLGARRDVIAAECISYGLAICAITSFFGWVDRCEAGCLKVKSEAVRLVKRAVDLASFSMPKPSQTVHLDQAADTAAVEKEAQQADAAVVRRLDRHIQEDQPASTEKNLLAQDTKA